MGSRSHRRVRQHSVYLSTYLNDRGIATKVHYAFFARSVFTEKAVAEAQKHDVILVDLELLGKVLE